MANYQKFATLGDLFAKVQVWMDIVGHDSRKTTEIYRYRTKESWDKIKNALDDLEI